MTVLEIRQKNHTRIINSINEAKNPVSQLAAENIIKIIKNAFDEMKNPLTVEYSKDNPWRKSFPLNYQNISSIFENAFENHTELKEELFSKNYSTKKFSKLCSTIQKQNIKIDPNQTHLVSIDPNKINLLVQPILKETYTKLNQMLGNLRSENIYQCFDCEISVFYSEGERKKSYFLPSASVRSNEIVIDFWFG